MFREGDEIICIQSSKCRSYLEGKTYIVKETQTEEGPSATVSTVLDEKGSTHNGWISKRFVLKCMVDFEKDLGELIK